MVNDFTAWVIKRWNKRPVSRTYSVNIESPVLVRWNMDSGQDFNNSTFPLRITIRCTLLEVAVDGLRWGDIFYNLHQKQPPSWWRDRNVLSYTLEGQTVHNCAFVTSRSSCLISFPRITSIVPLQNQFSWTEGDWRELNSVSNKSRYVFHLVPVGYWTMFSGKCTLFLYFCPISTDKFHASIVLTIKS